MKSNITGISQRLLENMGVVASKLDLGDQSTSDAWAEIEFFCAVAIRVLGDTSPTKIQNETKIVATQLLLK